MWLVNKIKCVLFDMHSPSGYIGFNGVNQTSTCQCCLKRIELHNNKWIKSL